MSGYWTNGVPQPSTANGAWPLTGAETIPMDTNVASGGGPESVAPTTAQLFGTQAPYAATDGATIDLDASVLGNNGQFSVTIAGNRDIVVANPSPGQILYGFITQGSGGSHGLTVTDGVYPGGTLSLSTGAGNVDLIQMVYNATDEEWTVYPVAKNNS